MRERLVLVVGDKFAQFTAGKDAITLSHLMGLLGLPAGLGVAHGRMVMLPGQGLGDKAVDALLKLAETSPHRAHFDFSHWYHRPRRANHILSHKHQPENSLISEPRRIADDLFELDLMIDENCELMADHQTGQHLSGTLLFEAARQSLLAVTEAFFLPQEGRTHEFVLKGMTTSYNRFCFPLDARLRYQIREKDLRSSNKLSFSVQVTVEQCGMDVASFEAELTAFTRPRLGTMEATMASAALEQHLLLASASRRDQTEERVRLPEVA